ncbi:histidine utilization repressor [Ottowia testudinis]|uniref:Histidine utilization repressor n=1 Tax=Ottowia testudinis TaxID=2816950 RepID=A0A975H3A4_9BURK|nr:histidine utilization repressor [Ottowia testudinis]QTD45708.1 histidine utilization repressor [Ottowia testudinis]
MPASAAPAHYARVKQHLLDGMARGDWPAGARLPSESELVAQFGLSRMTVNRALRELAADGRITRVAGVGSFVAEKKPQSTLLHIASIGNEVRARGHAYDFDLLTAQASPAPLAAAEALEVAPGTRLAHVLGVHRDNGTPVQLEERWVNPRLAPRFLAQDWRRTTPSDYLVQHVPYDEIEHLVDAVLPTAEQARLLEMPSRAPCLLLTRRTFSALQPVTWVRCWHPADRFQLGSRFARHGH